MEPQFCVRYLAFICLETFRINPIFYVSTTDTCVVSFFRKQRELEIHGGAVICLLTNWSFDRPNQHFQKWLKLSLQNWKIHPLQRKQKYVCKFSLSSTQFSSYFIFLASLVVIYTASAKNLDFGYWRMIRFRLSICNPNREKYVNWELEFTYLLNFEMV